MANRPVSFPTPDFVVSQENIEAIAHKICGPNVAVTDEVVFVIQNTIQLNILKISHIAINLAYRRVVKHLQVLQRGLGADAIQHLPTIDKVEILPEDLQSACMLFLDQYIPTPQNLQTPLNNALLKRKHYIHDPALHHTQTTSYIRSNITNGLVTQDYDLHPTMALGLPGAHKKRKAYIQRQNVVNYSKQLLEEMVDSTESDGNEDDEGGYFEEEDDDDLNNPFAYPPPKSCPPHQQIEHLPPEHRIYTRHNIQQPTSSSQPTVGDDQDDEIVRQVKKQRVLDNSNNNTITTHNTNNTTDLQSPTPLLPITKVKPIDESLVGPM